jgi:glycosyltransferase involved in cell wall biosynthesis
VRILTLNYEFPPIGGGGSPVSYELGRELVAQGHEVDVVTMGYNGLPAREVVDGIDVHRVPCLRKRREICKTHEMASFVMAALPKVAKLAATRNYDVNHTHFIVPTGLLARLLQLKTGLPLVISLHGSDVPGYNPDRFTLQHRAIGPLWRWIVKGASHLLVPSSYLQQLADRQGHGRPTTVIPHGFRYERFRADGPKEKRILVVARMIPRKGIQHLLEALRGFDLKGFGVDIVGDGPYLPTLMQMAAELHLPVKFWGWLDNDSAELRRLYEGASIFVMSSEAESFGVVLLEAMASGQAIVTCSGTGAAEAIGQDALLVPRDGRIGCGPPLKGSSTTKTCGSASPTGRGRASSASSGGHPSRSGMSTSTPACRGARRRASRYACGPMRRPVRAERHVAICEARLRNHSARHTGRARRLATHRRHLWLARVVVVSGAARRSCRGPVPAESAVATFPG